MGILKRKSIWVLCAMIAFGIAGGAIAATPDLPKDLVMKDTFKPGYGSPIGKFRTVQGKVIVMHANLEEGYWAKKRMPLFKGDIIVTQKKSRANFVMNDKSIISLSSNTKLTLTKSIYDEKKKRRSSFLGLSLGKARFIVSKLLSFKRREFKVKTVTAVCGVRGSDFIIVATDNFTEVTALEDTKLTVVSLAKLDAPPVIVQDFERTGVEMGQVPYETVIVPPEEIQTLMQDVSSPSEGAETGEQQNTQQGESSEENDTTTEDSQEQGSVESDTASEEAQEDDAADDEATTEEQQEGESAEEDTATEEVQEGESTEGDASAEEASSDEPASEEAAPADGAQVEEPLETETSAGDTQESDPTAEYTTEDEAGIESDAVGDQETGDAAGAGVAATGKAVGVMPGTGDTTPDVAADPETPGDLSTESEFTTEGTDINQTGDMGAVETEGGVDPGAVLVPTDVLVEPEVPTEIEQPVVDIENIILDTIQETQVAQQVAEQKLQEDLELPDIPGVPE